MVQVQGETHQNRERVRPPQSEGCGDASGHTEVSRDTTGKAERPDSVETASPLGARKQKGRNINPFTPQPLPETKYGRD